MVDGKGDSCGVPVKEQSQKRKSSAWVLKMGRMSRGRERRPVDSLGKCGSVVDEWMDGCERVGQVEQSRVLLLPSAISLEYCRPVSSVVASSLSLGLPKYCLLGRFPARVVTHTAPSLSFLLSLFNLPYVLLTYFLFLPLC